MISNTMGPAAARQARLEPTATAAVVQAACCSYRGVLLCYALQAEHSAIQVSTPKIDQVLTDVLRRCTACRLPGIYETGRTHAQVLCDAQKAECCGCQTVFHATQTQT